VLRIASGNGLHFTEWQWACRIGRSLATHFFVFGWCAAAAGAWMTFRKRAEPGFRFIGWACLSVFLMDVLFVGLFQNDSYIHEYIAFYFLVPVAVMMGVALDAAVGCVETRLPRSFRRMAIYAGAGLVVMTAFAGKSREVTLRRPYRILDFSAPEPPGLIPALGQMIRAYFPPGTQILCDFMPVYGPHLGYYAQRDVVTNLTRAVLWKRFLPKSLRKVGGIIWMGDRHAMEIILHLPPGSKQLVRFKNVWFCLWKPTITMAPGVKG
jgi:hypothetical protein